MALTFFPAAATTGRPHPTQEAMAAEHGKYDKKRLRRTHADGGLDVIELA
ncbi:hypothetical protein ABIA39_000005 [Nocardia sp. GAS34]